MANLRFVYRESTLKLGTVAVRILLENASFRQVLKPVRTSKLTFSRVIWRSLAKHPLGFRVVLVTTTSIHLHIQIMLWDSVQTFTLQILQLCHYTKNPAFRQLVFAAEGGRTQHRWRRGWRCPRWESSGHRTGRPSSAPRGSRCRRRRSARLWRQPVSADFPRKFSPVVEIFTKYYYFKAILYKRLPGLL